MKNFYTGLFVLASLLGAENIIADTCFIPHYSNSSVIANDVVSLPATNIRLSYTKKCLIKD